MPLSVVRSQASNPEPVARAAEETQEENPRASLEKYDTDAPLRVEFVKSNACSTRAVSRSSAKSSTPVAPPLTMAI
jgi:hypothetical protein